MSQSHRLAEGGLIDRAQTLGFTFDGRIYQGHAGDTLASALLANGVRLVGRSFKYHRPRGLLAAGPEEPNGLVELGTGARREPNTKATTVELFDGLAAQSQNRWPSLAFDLRATHGLFSPLLQAGFYYKTFMWPAAFWERIYEPLIRRSAGLGRLSMEADPDTYEKAHAFCDVLVIGGGAAGLAATLAAGRAGARVILADEDFRLGGRLLAERAEIGGKPAALWADEIATELRSLPNVKLLPRTAIFGAYDCGTYGAIEKVSDHLPVPPQGRPRQRLWKIVARRTVLAAGAIERPMVFSGNDRPGVMLASAARSYVNRFAALPGRRAIIFTASDEGWRTAADLAAAGAEVAAVVDPRTEVAPSLLGAAKSAHIRTLLGARVREAHGGRALSAATITLADGRTERLSADLLAMANGANPNIGLASHHGHRPAWNEPLQAFLADALPPGMSVAGAAAGHYSLPEVLRSGAEAGRQAAEDLGFAPAGLDLPDSSADPVSAVPLWQVCGSSAKAFVDFQNDVTARDVELAEQEGFRSVEHLKRYTTLGMATDQGRTSNVTGLALMAGLTGRSIADTGVTIARPPHVPVAIGAFASLHAGRHFKPFRLSAGHHWAEEHDATFVEAGQWLRPQWFARPGERDWLETVNREVRAVRGNVGICDVSTLGKIEIHGPNAGVLLDRVYINMFSTLAIGRARYGMMLREDGIAMDDGTTARLGETHYVMSTTTANAARVMAHLEFCRQVLWPELDVQTVSITEQWAQYAVAGPNSRRLLQNLFGDAFDLSPEAFPYMGAAEFRFGGTIVRLSRLSFSGELAFEVAVPAHHGHALIRRLIEAGRDLGVTPYGTEALGVMRIEKGHVAGNELNGQTTAADLGFGRMMSKKKDFIGRTLAARPGLTDPDRPVFAGFRPVDPAQRLSAGAHFIGMGRTPETANDEGYMTSVAFSPTLGHSIGLGLIRSGPERYGERVRAWDGMRGTDIEVEICNPIFVDPEGARLQHV